MKDMRFSLSIIIPLLRMPPFFERFYQEIEDYLTDKQLDYEIIFVHNKLKKKQRSILHQITAANPHVLAIRNEKGILTGSAIRQGIEIASKDLICLFDVSGRYDIECLDAFLVEIEARDFVLGYRFPRSDSVIHKIEASIYRFFSFIFFHMNRKDINCSMKIFRSSVIKELNLDAQSSAIYLEIVYKLQKRSKTYFEIPIVYLPKKYGTPYNFSLAGPFYFLVELIRIKLNL